MHVNSILVPLDPCLDRSQFVFLIANIQIALNLDRSKWPVSTTPKYYIKLCCRHFWLFICYSFWYEQMSPHSLYCAQASVSLYMHVLVFELLNISLCLTRDNVYSQTKTGREQTDEATTNKIRLNLSAIHTSELDRSEIDLSPKQSECERSNANWHRSKFDLNEHEQFLKANWDRSQIDPT